VVKLKESVEILEIKTGDSTIDLVLDTLKKDKQVLVFVNSKRSAEKTAEDISKQLKESEKGKEMRNDVLKALSSPTKQCRRLSSCVEKRTAFHHAGLTSKQRELIEDAFRNGDINVICSTPTLCLSGDTDIWTESGETKISKFKISKPFFVLSQNKLNLMKAQKIEQLENLSKLIKITSVCKYSIKVTPNHKMLIKRDGKRRIIKAREVKKTDKIATIGKLNIRRTSNPSMKKFIKGNEFTLKDKKFDKDLSYFIGAMLGDGYSGGETEGKNIKYKGSPTIVGQDQEVFYLAEKVCKSLNINYRKKYMFNRIESRILGKNKWFREFLVRCGIEKREKKHISEHLMIMNLENTAAILQGLFDTDGFVQKNQGVGFSNTSEKLVKQIQKLLLRFRIITRIRERKEGEMKIYKKTYKTLKHFEVMIFQKKSILDYHKKIGFRISRKQNSLNELVEKINSNINYFCCGKCNYKVYKDIFSGRSKSHKVWGTTKLKIIKILGERGELTSRELKEILGEIPRKKDLRLNHHYEFINKRKFSNRDWLWSLNEIGNWIFNKLIKSKKNISQFFNLNKCPLCRNKLQKVIKDGWRSKDFDGDIFWDQIKNVEWVAVEKEVYDVVLPIKPENDHLFVANGFIVHNSLGIDLPAYRAIIKNVKRYTSRGMQDIPVMEYHQICGRAGRPGKETEGEAIVVASNSKAQEKILKKFVKGKPEEILSKLAVEPVLRTYLLSLISADFVSNNKEIKDFFAKTFWAHQYQDMFELNHMLEKTIEELETWGFVLIEGKSNEDFVSATELIPNYTVKSTILGKRISQLYLDPLSAHKLIQNLTKADQTKREYFSYLFNVVNTNEMRPFLNVKDSELDKLDIMIERNKINLAKIPEPWDEDYYEFTAIFKTSMLLDDWLHEKDEESLLESYGVRPGELQYKLNNLDWLLYSCQELSRILKLKESIKILTELRLRAKYGVKKELLTLLKLKGVGRIRARLLHGKGFTDLGKLKNGKFEIIAKLLGPSVAKSIKEQLGEKVDFEYRKVKNNGDNVVKEKHNLEKNKHNNKNNNNGENKPQKTLLDYS
jgi:helicase